MVDTDGATGLAVTIKLFSQDVAKFCLELTITV